MKVTEIKMPKKPVYRMVLLACLLPLLAQAVDSRLETAKATYEKQLASIQTQSSSSGDWKRSYSASLLKLKNSFQAAAELENLIAAQNEIKRFEFSNELTENNVVSAPAKLADLQKQYLKLCAAPDIKKSKDILELTDHYVTHLEKLKKALTVAGDVESALAAKTEIERAEKSPVVAEARAAVAEAEGKAGAAEEPGGVDAGAGGDDVPAPTVPMGYTVYKEGETPPRVPGLPFSRLPMLDTGHTALSQKLASVVATRARTKMSVRLSRYSPTTREVETDIVRLHVRHTRTSTTLKDQTVKIEFFTKGEGSDDRIAPTVTGVGTISVPVLTSTGFIVDCPQAASMQSSNYRPGAALYGVLVSVYNSDGTLSWQGMSASGLKAAAAASKVRSAQELAADAAEIARLKYEEAKTAYAGNPNDPAIKQAHDEARDAYYRAKSLVQ